jgi:leader peptidase (prepilin peptidase)/N-methyltransferase
MLERAWRAEQEPDHAFDAPYNLCVPRSACTSCGHILRVWENIPVFSYLALRGRCGACRTSISIRYVLVELVTAAFVGLAVWHFGLTARAFWASALSAALVALACIDAETGLLPDVLTIPLLWAGLAANFGGAFASLRGAVLGAMVGYGFLWIVCFLFKTLTGREGLGHGDLKLFAALGAWFGVAAMSQVFLLSFIASGAFGAFVVVRHGKTCSDFLPFGPFIALAGVTTLFCGAPLNAWPVV